MNQLMPYREEEDRLGADERDGEAVRQLGHWRDRVRARILLISALVGLAIGVAVIYSVTALQYEYGVVSVRIGIVVATVFFVAAMFAGRLVGRVFVARRMAAKIDELAKAYEIPRETLAATADLLRGL
jgi:hypothetical protein